MEYQVDTSQYERNLRVALEYEQNHRYDVGYKQNSRDASEYNQYHKDASAFNPNQREVLSHEQDIRDASDFERRRNFFPDYDQENRFDNPYEQNKQDRAENAIYQQPQRWEQNPYDNYQQLEDPLSEIVLIEQPPKYFEQVAAKTSAVLGPDDMSYYDYYSYYDYDESDTPDATNDQQLDCPHGKADVPGKSFDLSLIKLLSTISRPCLLL